MPATEPPTATAVPEASRSLAETLRAAVGPTALSEQRIPPRTGPCNSLTLPPPVRSPPSVMTAVDAPPVRGAWSALDNAHVVVEPGAVHVVRASALLVGTLDSDARGGLRIAHCAEDAVARLVVAPPPGPAWRGAAAWARDWRWVPSAGGRGGVFEVLLGDLVDMRAVIPAEGSGEGFLSEAKGGGLVSVRGVVRAKSAILAERSDGANFLLEMGSCGRDIGSAVAVVFKGMDAVAWWPFLHVGRNVCIDGLKNALLTGGRKVFKAASTRVRICEWIPGAASDCALAENPPFCGERNQRSKVRCVGQRGTVEATGPLLESPRKRPRVSAVRHSVATITYEGQITRVFSDGRFELDDSVVLHLGGFYGSSAGVTSQCFRRGARIEAQWVNVVRRRGKVAALFPSARTIISLLYFGQLVSMDDLRGCHPWNKSPWRLLWKQFSPGDMLWTEELYTSLMQKFQPWLEDSGSQHPRNTNDDVCHCPPSISGDLINYMLGSREQTGLVQYVMHVLTDDPGYITDKRRDDHLLYREFLSTEETACQQQPTFSAERCSFVPSIADLSRAIDVLWNMHISSRLPHPSDSYHGCTVVYAPQAVFSSSEIAEILLKPQSATNRDRGANSRARSAPAKSSSASLPSSTRASIALVGLLQGSGRANGCITVGDCTGSVLGEALGVLEPTLLGAIVGIPNFCIAVDGSIDGLSKRVTLLFETGSAKIVVDGPYVCIPPDSAVAPALVETSTRRRSHVPVHPSQGLGSQFTLRLTQQTSSQYPRGTLLSASEAEECAIANWPLIALFVEKILFCSNHFVLEGRLMAFSDTRKQARWISLDYKGIGFWKCRLTLRGEAAVKVRPIIQEQELFAVSCSELDGVSCILRFCQQRALEGTSPSGRTVLELHSESESQTLWIKNLRRGLYMKFKAKPQTNDNNTRQQDTNDSLCHLIAPKPKPESEQHAYVCEAIEAFTGEMREGVKSCLPDVFSFRQRLSWCSDDSDMVSVSGTVVACYDAIEAGDSLYCMPPQLLTSYATARVAKLVLRDDEVQLFTMQIFFSPLESRPCGLLEGMQVIVRNIKRVVVCGKGIASFYGTTATTIRRRPSGTTSAMRSVSLCCNRPLGRIKDLQKIAPNRLLWEFTQAGQLSASQSDSAFGFVRADIVSVNAVTFERKIRKDSCSFCTGDGSDSDAWWQMDAHASFTIDDGTTEGELICRSFRTVMETLGGGVDVASILRATLNSKASLHFTPESFKPPKDGRPAPLDSQNYAHNLLCALFSNARRSIYALVWNQTTVPPSRNSNSLDNVEVLSFPLGYNRKLWTSVAPALHMPRVECVAVFEEGMWLSRPATSVATPVRGMELVRAAPEQGQ